MERAKEALTAIIQHRFRQPHTHRAYQSILRQAQPLKTLVSVLDEWKNHSICFAVNGNKVWIWTLGENPWVKRHETINGHLFVSSATKHYGFLSPLEFAVWLHLQERIRETSPLPAAKTA